MAKKVADIIIMNDEELENPTNGFLGNPNEKGSGFVTNCQDLNMRLEHCNPFPKGLYDPYIFNNPNKCICGQTHAIGQRCPTCRVKVVDFDTYITSYALFKSPVPYVGFIKLSALSNELKKYISVPNKAQTIQDFWSMYLKESDEPFEGSTTYFTIEGKPVHVQLLELPEQGGNYKNAGLFGLQKLGSYYDINGNKLNKISDLINYDIVITSPGVRPLHKVSNGNGTFSISLPNMTINYRAIISFSHYIKMFNDKSKFSLVDFMTCCCELNAMINRHFSDSELLQPSKQSLGRSIIDTRVGVALRAGIVPCLDLPMNKVRLPWGLFYEACQNDIIKQLTDKLTFEYKEQKSEKPEKIVIQDAKKLYKRKDPRAIEVCTELANSSMCTITRNPSLHKFSKYAFYIELWDEAFIGLVPAVDEPYNADHDGDTVAAWIYTDPEDVAKLMFITPEHLWTYDKRYECPMKFSKELAYGLYVATEIKGVKSRKVFKSLEDAEKAFDNDELKVWQECTIKAKRTTYGRAKLSKLSGIDIDELIKCEEQRQGKTFGGIDKNVLPALMMAMNGRPNRVQEYLDIQNFARKIATIVGLGPVPYQALFGGTQKEIKDIINNNEYKGTPSEIMLQKKEALLDLYKKEIRKGIEKLPESNIDELMKTVSKVKLDTLVQVYAPSINGETLEDLASNIGDSLFEGTSERTYTIMAEHDRQTLKLKQDLVPVGGFDQRQLANICIDVRYKENDKSTDEIGVIIDGKYAQGRTDLKTGKVYKTPVLGRVRVKSCATSNNENIVCGDEIAKYKFTIRDGAGIGASFASAITENLMQSGLAFKHGGNLSNLETVSVEAYEDGYVEEITEQYILISGKHEYKYVITNDVVIMDGIVEGETISKGDCILKKLNMTKADYNLSLINTLLDLNVADENLGGKFEICDSYIVSSGEIHYGTDTFEVGGIHYRLNKNELYFYPEGYKLTEGTRVSTGVPDILNLSSLTKDEGILYYVFISFILNVISAFDNFNSEPFELLFKQIKNNNYSVQQSLMSTSNFIRHLNYGDSVNLMSKTIKEAYDKAKPIHNDNVEALIKIDDVARAELESSSVPTLPTSKQVRKLKNFKTKSMSGDYSGLVKEMLKSSSDKEEYVTYTWQDVKNYLSDKNSSYSDKTISEIKKEFKNWLTKTGYGSNINPYMHLGRDVSLLIVNDAKDTDIVSKQTIPSFDLGNSSILLNIVLGIKQNN